MAHYTILPLLLFTHFILFIGTPTKAEVPAIIVFGDSTADTGNNNQLSTVLKSNFQPYGRDFAGGKPTGRFSNGRIPADFISEAFGIKPTVPAYLDPAYSIKDFATGVCFASAGTGYDNVTSGVLNVMPLWKEIEYYKEYQTKLRAYIGKEKADHVLSESLYLLSVGTNDFLENYYLPTTQRASQFTVTQFQDFLIERAGNFIKELHSLGARKLSVTGVPPMGCLPLERLQNSFYGSGCNEEYNKVGRDFNIKLQGLIVKLNQELPGMDMVFADAYDILQNMIQNPSRHGFENVAVACCGTGMFEMGYLCNQFNMFTCTDTKKYIFWDAFHPTEKTSHIIAKHIVKRVLYKFM